MAFTDCDDSVVLATLGVVNGVGGGSFMSGFFTIREQATALARTAQVLGIQPSGGDLPFVDASEASGWASADVQARLPDFLRGCPHAPNAGNYR